MYSCDSNDISKVGKTGIKMPASQQEHTWKITGKKQKHSALQDK
jgi:hypothetical protein